MAPPSPNGKGGDRDDDAKGAVGGAAGGPAGAAGGAHGTTAPPGATGTTPKRDVPPPPLPQLFQMTPELFQQTVSTAVAAALAAQQQTVAAPAQPLQAPAAVSAKEKKLADFWISRPTMWFRLFSGAYPNTLSEDRRFNTLLNHLPSEALPFVDHILRAPGDDPFTRAKANLIRHYEESPRDLARKLRNLTSLGDRTPSDMLYYMRSLLPGVPDNSLFEVIFLDLLPANARDAAVKFDNLEQMATAADKVLAEQPQGSVSPVDISPLSVSAVASERRLQPSSSYADLRPAPVTDLLPLEQVNALRQRPQSRRAYAKETDLCYIHARFGTDAYKCADLTVCKMKNVSRPRPPPGNAKAGR